MPTSLENLMGEFRTKTEELAKIFESKKAADGRYDLTPEELDDVRARRAELNTLGADVKSQRELADAEQKTRETLDGLDTPLHPSAFGAGKAAAMDAAPERKSLFDHVKETAEFKSVYASVSAGRRFQNFSVDLAHLDVKTVMTETGTGFAPPNFRTPIVIPSAQRKPVVADLVPQDPTNLQAVKYMEETTFTNNTAPTAEGSALPANLLGYTERTVLVEWLGAILPVTEQQLEDVPSLSSILNNRLTLQLMLTEENQLLNGNGTSPQLAGYLNKSGINTQAMGSDPIFDAVLKAITLVRYTGFADPSGIVMNPTDWQTVRLVKTTLGNYVMGNPDTAGPEMLFGLPVIVTPAITQGTALLGDFRGYSQIYRNQGLRIEVGYINDDFSRGQKTIKASERLSLVIYRAAAFSTVTGLHS